MGELCRWRDFRNFGKIKGQAELGNVPSLSFSLLHIFLPPSSYPLHPLNNIQNGQVRCFGLPPYRYWPCHEEGELPFNPPFNSSRSLHSTRSYTDDTSLSRLTGLAKPPRRSFRLPLRPSGRSDGRLSRRLVLTPSPRKLTFNTLLSQRSKLTSRSGEFTLYDHLLDHSFNFGVVPQRYVEQKLSPLDTYFAMGRGRQDKAKGVDVVASEMGKL